jgi:hypothetical protein
VRAVQPALQTYPTSVQYGDLVLDERIGCIICSEWDHRDDRINGEFYVEFRCRIKDPTGYDDSDDTQFSNWVSQIETALKLPRQRLKVKFGSQPFVDYNFLGGTTQTAILIEPELRVIRSNRRDIHYGFRVRCQFPGNVPFNAFRRDSLTKIRTSLRERRVCFLTGTWTSAYTKTAYQNYLENADDFCAQYLPLNGVDQFGNVGTWIRADEDPGFNDEQSIITATREYWEVFLGRRDSVVRTITTIDNLRAVVVGGTWAATPGFTALQNYTDGGDAYWGQVLPDAAPGGEWVKVDEEPSYNDQNALLVVNCTFHEVINGLREFHVETARGPAMLRTVVVSGFYYTNTAASAKDNYTNDIVRLIQKVVSDEGLTRYESMSVPRVTGYDTTGLRYMFRHTLNELAYPQSVGQWDDPRVVFEVLEIKSHKPVDAQAFSLLNPVTRLKTASAYFVASIDITVSDDPEAVWTGALRDHVRAAIITKLGSDVRAVCIVDEEVGVGLNQNQIVGRLDFVVTGGGLLSMRIKQTVTQVPGRDFLPLGDGTNFSYRDMRCPPEKLLHREATVTYVLGTALNLFKPGDAQISGFGIIDTGKTAQESVDDQNSSGKLPFNSWYIDRRSGAPYAYTSDPVTMGDQGFGLLGFQVVFHKQVEDWRYVVTLQQGELT